MNNQYPYNEPNATYEPTTLPLYNFTDFNQPSVDDERLKKEKSSLANKILVWGIVSLVLADTGALSILGVVFSFKVRKYSKQYLELAGEHCKKSRIGSILGTVALYLGLALTVLAIISFIGSILSAAFSVVSILAGVVELLYYLRNEWEFLKENWDQVEKILELIKEILAFFNGGY